MSEHTMLQLMGTVALACVGALGLYVVANRLQWCTYGRQILAVLSAAQFYFVGIRIAFLAKVWEPHTTITMSGVGGLVLLAIIANLVFMHIQWHRYGLADPQDHRQKEGAT